MLILAPTYSILWQSGLGPRVIVTAVRWLLKNVLKQRFSVFGSTSLALFTRYVPWTLAN